MLKKTFLSGLILLLISAPVFAQTCEFVVQSVVGQAEAQTGDMFQILKENDSIHQGAEVRTSKDSKVDLLCNDRLTFRVFAQSKIQISVLNDKQMVLQMKDGEVLIMNLQTEENSLKILGGSYFEGSAWEGAFRVRFTPQDALPRGQVSVRKGNLKLSLKELGMTFDVT